MVFGLDLFDLLELPILARVRGQCCADVGEGRIDVGGQVLHAGRGRERNQGNNQRIFHQVLSVFVHQVLHLHIEVDNYILHFVSPVYFDLSHPQCWDALYIASSVPNWHTTKVHYLSITYRHNTKVGLSTRVYINDKQRYLPCT